MSGATIAISRPWSNQHRMKKQHIEWHSQKTERAWGFDDIVNCTHQALPASRLLKETMCSNGSMVLTCNQIHFNSQSYTTFIVNMKKPKDSCSQNVSNWKAVTPLGNYSLPAFFLLVSEKLGPSLFSKDQFHWFNIHTENSPHLVCISCI